MPRALLPSVILLCAGLALADGAAQPDRVETQAPWSKPLWVVHRGGEIGVPENTMAAIRHSVEQGARYLEVDLQTTADGKIVLLHDETLDRTTTGEGKLIEHTWAQIKDLDAGSWKDTAFADARIPLLSEVLGYCKANGVRLLLDIKSPGAAGAGLYELLNQFDMLDDCRVYMRAGAAQPEVKAALDARLVPFPGSLVQPWGKETPREKMQKALDNEKSMGGLVSSYQWVLDFEAEGR